MSRPDKTLGGMETLKDAFDQSLGDMSTMQLDQKGIGQVDRYELLEKLGEGGFGVVYGARDTEAGILVALKALPAEVSCDVEEMTSIRNNFALVSRLHHPGIASVLHLHKVENSDGRAAQALGVKRGDYLVVMEYVPGATLFAWRQALPDKKMPVFQTLEIARQIAAALDYAHSQRVLHRDIKSKNIMVAQGATAVESRMSKGDGGFSEASMPSVVKVLDFGLAAEIRSSMSRKSKEPQNSKSGTPLYMAPEQWSGLRQGPAADQYALAVLVYELIGGEVPFKSAFDSANFEIMRSVVLSETPTPLDELDKKQNAVLQQALAKNPDGRFASCVEFVEALVGGKFSRKGAKPAKKESQTGIQKSVIAAALLAAAGLLVLIVFIGSASNCARRHAAEKPTKQMETSSTRPVVEPYQQQPEAAAQPVRQTQSAVEPYQQPKAAIQSSHSKAAAPQEGKVWTADLGSGVSMEFVPIAAGSFMMGSKSSEHGDEHMHRVTLTKPFWLAKTEVTQAQYEQVMGSNPSRFKGNQNPVEQVSWNDAVEFCRKLTALERQAGRLSEGYEYTLPTEAQWEYACRAGTTGDYAGDLDAMAWYSGNTTHPVGTKQPNGWGLYDMHGNVWEWCSDWRGFYPSESVTDPHGASSGSTRMNRGGSWVFDALYCRSANRRSCSPGKTYGDLGFRPLVQQLSGTR